jgi:hypothetical protein
MQQQRENIFISYCREDDKWLQKFREMLEPVLRKERLAAWDDTKITPGTKWQQEIENAIAHSKVALLLVSPRFLASKFIMDYELPLLFEAREDGLTLLWVAVSHCMYQYSDLAEDQALYDPVMALDSLSSKRLNQVMVRICKRITEVMDNSSQNKETEGGESPPPQ